VQAVIPRITTSDLSTGDLVISALNIAAREMYSKSSVAAQGDDAQMARYYFDRGDEFRDLIDEVEKSQQVNVEELTSRPILTDQGYEALKS
jgi:hypothetical protein